LEVENVFVEVKADHEVQVGTEVEAIITSMMIITTVMHMKMNYFTEHSCAPAPVRQNVDERKKSATSCW
jgi:hypothetical protein